MVHKAEYTDNEWAIHSLNIHGTFFHRKIASLLYANKHIHDVTLEYPVEYSSGLRSKQSDESRLDILATFTDRWKEKRINLLIECKKANPEFVDWVFFPKFEGDTNNYTNLLRVTSVQPGEDALHVFNHQKVGWNIPISDEGRETRGEYGGSAKGTKTKTSNASISDAAYQVVLATHAIARDAHKARSDADAWNQAPDIYLPMIVTTANLYICEFDPDDTSVTDGEIPIEKAALKQVDKVIFRYPISPHLQIDLYEKSKITKYKTSFLRRDILVLSSKKFSETLPMILFQDYSD